MLCLGNAGFGGMKKGGGGCCCIDCRLPMLRGIWVCAMVGDECRDDMRGPYASWGWW